jgi:hypothetical protein
VQTAITPPVDVNGIIPESRWFDNSRLKFVGEGDVPVMTRPSFVVEKGPADKPSRDRLPSPR